MEEKPTERVRKNPWILSTLVLALVVLILVIANFTGVLTGKSVSKDEIGEQALNFFNTQLSC